MLCDGVEELVAAHAGGHHLTPLTFSRSVGGDVEQRGIEHGNLAHGIDELPCPYRAGEGMRQFHVALGLDGFHAAFHGRQFGLYLDERIQDALLGGGTHVGGVQTV